MLARESLRIPNQEEFMKMDKAIRMSESSALMTIFVLLLPEEPM